MSIGIKNISKEQYYDLLKEGYRTKDSFSTKESAQIFAFDIEKKYNKVLVVKRQDEVSYFVMAK